MREGRVKGTEGGLEKNERKRERREGVKDLSNCFLFCPSCRLELNLASQFRDIELKTKQKILVT